MKCHKPRRSLDVITTALWRGSTGAQAPDCVAIAGIDSFVSTNWWPAGRSFIEIGVKNGRTWISVPSGSSAEQFDKKQWERYFTCATIQCLTTSLRLQSANSLQFMSSREINLQKHEKVSNKLRKLCTCSGGIWLLSSECRISGKPMAAPRVKRFCKRLEKEPFFKSSVWADRESNPAYQLQWRVLNVTVSLNP